MIDRLDVILRATRGACAAVMCIAIARGLTDKVFAQGSRADYERAMSLGKRTEGLLDRDRVKAHWLPGNTGFWYRVQTGPKQQEVVLVDALRGTRQAGSEVAKRASAQTTSLSSDPDIPRRSVTGGQETTMVFANRSGAEVELFWLNFKGQRRSHGRLRPASQREMQTFAGHVWLVADLKGRELSLVKAADEPGRIEVDGKPLPAASRNQTVRGLSPNGKWLAFIKSNNIWLRSTATNKEYELSTDGTADDAYGSELHWSPDSTKLAAMQVKPAQERKVHFVESSPKDQLQPKLHTIDYLKPGDRIAHARVRLFAVTHRRQVAVKDELFGNPWSISQLRWAPDSSRFTFLDNQRGHQLLRIIAVDGRTGAANTLVEETSPTFIDYSQKLFSHWLDETEELVWMSERDGWNHLWLYDARGGGVKNQITRGPWVVRKVERVDAERRQIWFFAGGVRPQQDPYYLHLCRVNFDGTGFVVLTEGDGTHTVDFSPDRRWFVDTWSRIDQAPTAELRRSDDGGLVCLLERADATRLLAAGWTIPERFAAKGRDGQTDIYGIIIRPSNFDPAKRYPVIENIYAGPHGAFVPKAWDRHVRMHQLAELGFVVVQIDGMGTNWRSRAFHDVCWKNLKDAGFPDRIAWLRAAAQTRSWMDLRRVGIYGGSTGGMNALAGLLHHRDFYRVGVADCGCHDNRMDKIWWNEAWMGWPVGPEYAENSNVTHAHKLQGKLLLIVGEMDTNVDPASTMQVVNALEKADKDFDLLVMTGTGHGAAETAYGSRRRMDFFVRHLLDKEPRW